MKFIMCSIITGCCAILIGSADIEGIVAALFGEAGVIIRAENTADQISQVRRVVRVG
jgi:hypothetical protein